MLHAVIMAGGSGTRFWPLSRTTRPKQFLRLVSSRSLIQSVYDRCLPIVPAERFWVVTNASLVDQVAEDLPEIPRKHLLGEPCQRNTAPCIGLAATLIAAHDPDAVMLVMPADHVIQPVDQFQNAVRIAEQLVSEESERLVLFGVQPRSPATGYGYIEQGSAISTCVFEVQSFREKPDFATAEEYVASGRFLWNAGIFVWRARTILECLNQLAPEIAAELEILNSVSGTTQWEQQLAESFARMPSISIDYAVLEQARDVAVVTTEFEWDDIGSWEAMARLNRQDANGNTVIGRACTVDANDNILYSTEGHVIAVQGIKNCIIVQTPDATLVADRKDDNAIRQLVERLKEQGFDDIL